MSLFAANALFAAGPLDGQLWFINNGGPADGITGHVNSDGSNITQVTGIPNPQSLTFGVDLAAGLYFGVPDHLHIESHTITNAATVLDSIQIGNDLNTPSSLDDDIINALAVDPFTHTIYVGLWGQDGAHTGIVKVTYDPATGLMNHNAQYGTGGVYAGTQQFLITYNSTASTFTDARDFVIDTTNHILYYTDDDNQYNVAPFHPTNGIYKVNYAAPNPSSTLTMLTSQVQFPTNQSNGIIGPLGVSFAKGLVYFETNHAGNSAATLWYVPTTGGTAIAVGLPGGTALGFGDIPQGGLTVDPIAQHLYVTVQSGSAFAGPDQILQGVLSADGHSITSFINTYPLATLDGHTPQPNAHVADTWFDVFPTLSAPSGTTTHAGEQGAPITLLTATPTIADVDGDHLARATVQITGGTFSSNETSANDDHLAVPAASLGGTSITASYNSATETLTLSGYDTFAHYSTVLAAVQYNATGDNPTNYGLNPTRTIQWIASDGALNVPFGAQNSGSTTITIDAVNDAPANTVPGLQSANEDTNRPISITVADADSNPALDGMSTTLTVTHGTLTVVGAGSAVVTGNGTASVNITGPSAAINSTLATLTYLGLPNYNGIDSLSVLTNDNGHTGSGGSLSDNDNVSITVAAINDAPSGADKTTTILEDTPYAFVAADFGFSDPSDGSSVICPACVANTLSAVRITTLPAAGILRNNGVAVVAGSFVPVADINAGKLVFTPALNENGNSYAGITFQVQDNGGTANGGSDTDATPNTLVFNVTPVNDQPTDILLDATTIAENLPAGTTVGNLSSVDPDAGDVFTYSLVTGAGSTDNASFTITGNQLKTAASFDFETKSSYSIRARTTDSGNLTYDKIFTITVTDVFELTAPANVQATITSQNRVDLRWTAVNGALTYEIDRKSGGGSFALIGTSQANWFADTTVTPGQTYEYVVRAKNSSTTSPNSTIVLATAIVVSNQPITAGMLVQAAHLAQVRNAVNAVRAFGGLGAAATTDPALPQNTPVRAVHITELRSALDQGLAAAGMPAGVYTNTVAAGFLIRAADFEELRRATGTVASPAGTGVIPVLFSLSPSDTSIVSNGVVNYTVSLDLTASADTVVTLLLSDPGAGVFVGGGNTATVPAGASSRNFQYQDVSGAGTVQTVTAMLSPNSIQANITVAATGSHLVINEIDYDQIGATDNAEFIEVYNPTAGAISLQNKAIVLVNGASSAVYDTIDLSSAGTLNSHQYLVIAGPNVTPPIGAIKLDPGWATDRIQNGPPDGVALVDNATHTLIDALSYEGSITSVSISGFAAPVSLVEGTALSPATADSNTVNGSLCRSPNGQDTDDANTDWKFCTSLTAGLANP